MNVKKKMMQGIVRKALMVLVAIAMVTSSLPVSAFAEAAAGNFDNVVEVAQQDGAQASEEKKAVEVSKEAESSSDGPTDADSGQSAATDDGADVSAQATAPSEDDVVDASDMDNVDKTKMVEPELLSCEQFQSLLTAPMEIADAPARPASPKDEVDEADGTRIENISVEWITKDTTEDGNDARLSLVPGNDDRQTVRMRVNAAFSGKHDYEVGDIQISIPKTIFANRNGSRTGEMTLSVPEAPDTRGIFSYTEVSRDGVEYYVLSNVKKLSAATSCMFEFSIKGLRPHDIVGDPAKYVSDKFLASVELVTNAGTLLSKTSNEIDCTIDTGEKISKAYDRVSSFSSTWDESWPAEYKPQNPDDFVYVDWYSYAVVGGNQAYDISVKHDITASDIQGTVLGMTGAGVVGGGATGAEAKLATTTYSSSGSTAHYVHLYTAFPKDKIEAGKTYTFRDSVAYTLTDSDDGTETTATASAKRPYTILPFIAPAGHFGVNKIGVGGRGYETNGMWDPYGGYLNQLRAGKDVEIRYKVDTTGFGAPWTWVDANGDGKMAADELGHTTYDIDTDDRTMNLEDGDAQLTVDDYEFARLQVSKPTVYEYKQYTADGYGYYEQGGAVDYGSISAGQCGYATIGDPSAIPDVQVFGTIAGEEKLFATISWKMGSAVAQCENGATGQGDTIELPAGVTGWRTHVTTNVAGVIYNAYPTVRLKSASKAVSSFVQSLFKESDQPSGRVVDNATGTATVTKNGAPKTFDITVNGTGVDTLTGAGVAVGASKSVKYENDTANRLVKLHYTASTCAQSNLSSRTQYDSLVADGLISQDTSGVWYDLLPEGVVPDLDSVRAVRSGDTVESIDTIENYKDSGRTLLIVRMSLTPNPTYSSHYSLTGYGDQPAVAFDAVYSWEALTVFGAKLNNVIAYESGSEQYGTIKGRTGEPDDPTAGNNDASAWATKGVKDILTDLDPNSDSNSFVYARAENDISADTSALTNLTKRVSVNDNGVYGDGLGENAMNVYEGGNYTYRLTQMNVPGTTAKDLVFYDSLENYTPLKSDDDFGDAIWRGSLVSVDTSYLEAMGVAPVVYYSTVKDLAVTAEGDGANRDLSNKSIWSTTAPADLSTVTAIAIDASKAKDGSDFVLGEGETLVSYVRMKAPAGVDEAWFDSELAAGATEAGLAGGAHAYNDAAMTGTISSKDSVGKEDQLIRNSYVKVGLIPFEVEVEKAWADDDNRDGIRPESVTVDLYADGVATGKSAVLSKENKWKASFGKVPRTNAEGKRINYTVVENPMPAGHAASVATKVVDGKATMTITNTHTPEKTSVSGTKVWDDVENAQGKRPEKVQLTLYKNGEKYRFKTVAGDASASSWNWSFDDLYRYEGGKEIDYEVREDIYYPGYVTSTDETTGSIVNTYSPYGDLKISKAITDATDVSAQTEFSFKLNVTNEDGEPDSGEYAWERFDASGASVATGKVAQGGTVSMKGGESVVIKGIPSECSYKIDEIEADGWTVETATGTEGTIQAGATAQVSYSNKYSARGAVQIAAKKTLEGRELAARQFVFELVDSEGAVVRRTTNDAEGNITFGRIYYGLEDVGKTFTYTIREFNGGKPGYTYDTHEETVKVDVADNGDGTLSAVATYDEDGAAFNNVYAAKGDVAMKAWKTLTGRDLTDGEFSFELKDAEGTVLQTKQNTVDGIVEFDPINYTEADAGKTYTYTVNEVAGTDETVTYSDKVFTYTVEVQDDGDGTLSFDATTDTQPIFENVAKPGSLRIEKTVTDPESSDPNAEFEFKVQLTGRDGQKVDGEWGFKREQIQQLTGTVTLSGKDGSTEPGTTLTANLDAEAAGTLKDVAEENRSYEWHRINADGSDDIVATNGATYTTSDTDNGVNFYVIVRDKTGKVSGFVESSQLKIEKLIAFAVATKDNQLLMYKRAEVPEVGETFDGHVVDAVWTGIEEQSNWPKWSYYHMGSLSSCRVVDPGIQPRCTRWWFDGMRNLKEADLERLDTSRVTDMKGMFSSCSSLKTLDLSGLDTSLVTDMNWMFRGCYDLTSLNLSGLNTSSVTDMGNMFAFCSSLTTLNLLGLDTSSVTDMDNMFYGCSSLTSLDLSSFGTSSVTDMSYMFYGCSSLTTLNLSDFDTSSVTSMWSMFENCSVLEYDCSAWKVPLVSIYSDFNLGAPGVIPPVWPTAKTASSLAAASAPMAMSLAEEPAVDEGAPAAAPLAAGDIDGGTVKNAEGNVVWSIDANGLLTIAPEDGVKGRLSSVPWDNLKDKIKSVKVESTVELDNGSKRAFYYCTRCTEMDLSGLDTSAVTDMSWMFYGCSSLTSLDLSSFNTSSVTDMSKMFSNCTKLTSLDLSSFNTSSVTDMSVMFFWCSSLTSLDLSSFDTTSVKDMGSMFCYCSKLTSLDLSSFETPSVKNMSQMFYGCSSLTSLVLSRFDTSSVTNMYYMFSGCSNLTSLVLSSFDTPSVTDMSYMFSGCSSLTSLVLSSFDTSSVKNMSQMFCNCSKLTSLKLSSFDTSSVTNMSMMFYNCSKLTSLKLSSFDTSSVTNMWHMFSNCSKLTSLDLSSFDTSSVTNQSEVFGDCYSLSKVVLGTGFKSLKDTQLTSPRASDFYTGMWENADLGRVMSADELMNNWNPSAMAGTWTWQEKPRDYSVSFDANSDSALGEMKAQTWKLGEYGTLPESGFAWFDHEFTGWNTKADGTGTSYAAGEKLTADLATAAGQSITLYAQWKECDNKFTVTDGAFSIFLKGGEAAVIDGLPAGTGYVVSEKTPAGWVEVARSGDTGTIEPTKTSTAVFTNTYKPGSCQASIQATKLMDSNPAAAGAFSFQLLDADGKVLQTATNGAGGGIAFNPITFNAAGTYSYTVREVAGSNASIVYDSHELKVTVTVRDDGEGNLSAGVKYEGATVFENNTKPSEKYGSLSVTKKVTGTERTDDKFGFRVKLDGGKTVYNFDLAAGETKTFKDLAVGTTYEVEETSMPAGYTLVGIDRPLGSITAGSTASVTATNSYTASGSFAPAAKKVFEGGVLVDGQFSFGLYASDAAGTVAEGAQPVAVGTNDAQGNVVFEPVAVESAGTSYYVLREQAGNDPSIKYDATQVLVKVDAVDAGAGKLDCTVTYATLGGGKPSFSADVPKFTNGVKEGELKISKTVKDGTEAANARAFKFTVTLTSPDGSELAGERAYAVTDASGAEVSKGTIASGGTLKLSHGQVATIKVPAGTAYKVVEAAVDAYDSSAEGSEGTVSAGASSEAKFVNTYHTSGAWAPAVTKVLAGGVLAEGQFSFDLLDADGNLVETKTNARDGSVTFSEMDLTQDQVGKVLSYQIRERNDAQEGIVYDETTVDVSAKVVDDGKGNLSAEVTYGKLAEDGTVTDAKTVSAGEPGWTFTNRVTVTVGQTGRRELVVGLCMASVVLVASVVAIAGRRRNRKK